MYALWHWILYLLAWASHDPSSIAAERARAAGCVTVAYASLAQEPPAPAPRRIDRGAVADTPLFDAHRKKCSQCSKPLMDQDGTENSICEDGFALWQQDLRSATEKAQAKPAAPAPCPCGGKGYTVRPDGSRWACKCGECTSAKCRKNLP
jgi:hypothetical protein